MTELEDGTTLYSFYDFERSTPLIVLVVLFVGAVVALGRWRGVGALAGLVVSLAIIVWFALPSLVDGNNAVSVALVTAGAVAIVALYLAHGVGPATDVALLSTFASLALTGLLAWIFVEVGNFTGLTDDASFVLQSLETGIDPAGDPAGRHRHRLAGRARRRDRDSGVGGVGTAPEPARRRVAGRCSRAR